MSNVIDLNKALELVGGEKSLLIQLLNGFITEKKFDMNHFNELAENNWNEAASYVHYFKGAARQLCCSKVSQSGQNLEDVLRKKTEGNIQELATIFEKDYTEAYQRISEIVEIF